MLDEFLKRPIEAVREEAAIEAVVEAFGLDDLKRRRLAINYILKNRNRFPVQAADTNGYSAC
jgi:hypothetical protein